MHSVRQSILKGLFQPSGISALTAIATLIICIVSYNAWVTPEMMIRLSPNLAAQNNDRSARLTGNILELTHREYIPPSIFLVGDSTMDEGINLTTLSDILQASGSTAQIVNLLSGGQSILEAMAAIDNLPDSAQGTIVLGHSLRKLNLTSTKIEIARKGARRGYTSEAVGSFLEEHGHTSQSIYGLYSMDTFWFTAPRLANYYFNQFKIAINLPTSSRENQAILSPVELARSEQFYMTTVNQSYENHINNLSTGRDALLKIQDITSQRENLKLLVIETPLNPSLVENQLGSIYYQRYLKNISEYSRLHNISYRDAASLANLQASDFRDVLHLKEPAAISRFTHAVASLIVEHLNE